MKKSFTLIEILVYIAVLIIILLVISFLTIWFSKINLRLKAEREVFNNAQRAMEIIFYEIKEATSIYYPTSLFSTSSGQISLETKKYLSEGEKSSFIDFFICDKRLCLKKEGKEPIVITSDKVEITQLEFLMVATTTTIPSIKVNLTINYKNPKGKPELSSSINLSSTISLRSY